MELELRPFAPDDYEDAVALGNRVFPEYPETVEEWRHNDEHRNPKMAFRRFVAEVSGKVVAFGSYGQQESMFHPQKFWVEVLVDPDFRRRGIGTTLYDHITGALQPFDPITYWASAREDMPDSMRFLGRRGFEEVMRNWENHLYLAEANLEPFAGQVERVEASGVRLMTLAELESDPERSRRLYEMVDAVAADIPSPEAHTSVDYEQWIERLLSNPNLVPEGYFVAVDGDRYVGLSALWASQASPDELITGLTGTLREYRRRRIALALKLKSIAWARERGYTLIKTWNATTNEGMLAINEQLGFVKQPAWIEYAKALTL